MSRDLKPIYDAERYHPLGLIANPFTISEASPTFEGADLEVAAEARALVQTIMMAADAPAPKPIAVIKREGRPDPYFRRAIGLTQRALAADNGINVAFGYVQLFMMRLGRVRSIIPMLAERIAFREFDRTLACYIQSILAEHDTTLVAYQLLGEDKLNEFAEKFSADPLETTRELFGTDRVERHPELKDFADTRTADLDPDVDDEDALPEIDSTVGDAPANAVLFAEEDESEDVDDDHMLVDYIVEYTKAHLSPVIARAVRVYRERGQVALVNELRVTKAPKKTLVALVKFARARFKKVALIFDGFEGWYTVPSEMKAEIAATLSEVRWALGGDAVMVLMLEEGRVPELEEQFGGGTRIDWAFPSLRSFEEAPQLLDREIVESWLVRSTYPGTAGLTLDDPVLAKLFGASQTLAEFATRAGTAVENAADRGVAVLDDEALEEAMNAIVSEANEE